MNVHPDNSIPFDMSLGVALQQLQSQSVGRAIVSRHLMATTPGDFHTEILNRISEINSGILIIPFLNKHHRTTIIVDLKRHKLIYYDPAASASDDTQREVMDLMTGIKNSLDVAFGVPFIISASTKRIQRSDQVTCQGLGNAYAIHYGIHPDLDEDVREEELKIYFSSRVCNFRDIVNKKCVDGCELSRREDRCVPNLDNKFCSDISTIIRQVMPNPRFQNPLKRHIDPEHDAKRFRVNNDDSTY
jgi:hypothetical protein